MITFTLFRQYLALLRKRHINVDKILAQSTITIQQLEDPNCRITVQQHDELWGLLLEAVPFEALALKNADTLAPASFSSLMYLAMSHHQGIDALTTLLNYKNQGSDIKIQLQQSNDMLSIGFNDKLFELQHWQYFLLIAAQHILDVLSWLKGETLKPAAIHLPKNMQSSFAEFLDSHAHCIELTRTDRNTERDTDTNPKLVFKIEQLHFPLTGSHPQVRSILESQTKNELLQYQLNTNIRDDLTKYLLQAFQISKDLQALKASITLDKTAQHFIMTSRTLQRKLKQQGSSFSKLLDKVRLQQYEQGLKRNLMGDDLAEFCGFNDFASVQKFIQRVSAKSQ